MNERIKALINQSYVEVPHERDWDATSSVFDKEKFADLIVNEFDVILANEFLDCVGTNDKKAAARIERLRTRVKNILKSS